jgi:hypothetical protein
VTKEDKGEDRNPMKAMRRDDDILAAHVGAHCSLHQFALQAAANLTGVPSRRNLK